MEQDTETLLVKLDKEAEIPYLGWAVQSHTKQEPFIWDPTKVELFLHDKQTGAVNIDGTELLKELAHLPVANANMLDFLTRNIDLIPQEWQKDEHGKNRQIYFWGTIYLGHGWAVSVRRLSFREGQWFSGQLWTGNTWDSTMPCVIIKP
ncbi:MAG: hypothetical protein ABIO57_01500 [Candidatus Paceibacterota bacterium]